MVTPGEERPFLLLGAAGLAEGEGAGETVGTKLDLAPQCTSPEVSLGGGGMLHHKKWSMELALFRKKPNR